MEEVTVTSTEKQAAYKHAFIENIVNAVKATRPDRYEALRQTNYSIVGQLLGGLETHGAVGARRINKTLLSARKRISDVDTALGAALAGKHWNTPKSEIGNISRFSRFRKAMFTDSKENLIETGKDTDMFRKFRVPSATAPVREVANIAVPMWAMSKAYETVDALKQRNPQGGPL